MASTPTTVDASIELGALDNSQTALQSRSEDERREEAVALHPVDGGFHAWLFVFSSFVLECLVWGFPFCYGIFQNWYLTHEFSGASEASINAVGTVSLGMQYLEGIFCIMVARRYPHRLRMIMQVSLLVCVVSMFASSFATQVWQLIILQGIIYGIAAGFLYAPVIFWVTDWFVERRSLATALIFGGGGLGGAVFPLLMEYLLERTGFRWTLRAWSLIMLVLGGISIMGTKPRVPIAPTSRPAPLPPIDLKFAASPLFVAVASTILVQGLAYFCVSLYIPSYAAALGYSRIRGTIALSVFNLASVVGQVFFGYYCDRRPFTGIMVFSGITSSILAYCLWGFAHTLTTVYIFIVLFASISGGFSSIFAPASAVVAAAQPATGYMAFGIFKGVSVIVGPLIAAALHPSKSSSPTRGGHGAGGWGGYGFTGITIFVGSAMAATSVLSVVSAFVRHRVLLGASRTPIP